MIRPLRVTAPFVLALAVACGGGAKDADTTPATTDTTADTTAADTSDTAATGDSADTGDTADTAGGGAEEQVAQGAGVWGDACAMCHGDSGEGKGKKNPAVVGDGSLGDFATAADLHAYIAKEMPADDPGSLSDEDSWAVTAWIASQNGNLGADALTPANAASVSLQ